MDAPGMQRFVLIGADFAPCGLHLQETLLQVFRWARLRKDCGFVWAAVGKPHFQRVK